MKHLLKKTCFYRSLFFFIYFLLGSFVLSAQAQHAGRIITGIVKDAEGLEVIGATVLQEGTNNGVTTNIDGKFSIKLVEGSQKLIISYIGYQTKTVLIKSTAPLNIILETQDNVLEEVTVVAYGVQKKETVTGAISSVGTKDLLRSPNPSVANTLAGQLSGVSTVQQSGQPGKEDPQIYVRGTGTLTNEASKPLILVDGVEMPFFQMDPNEIESITVLKDASATAVFGVRGANGVILVTTRRGQEGKAKVALSSSFGITRPTRLLEMADSYQYALRYNEMEINDGKRLEELSFQPYALEMFRTNADPIMYPNIDWTDYLYKNLSMQTQHNINISGGTSKVRYFVSAGILYQNGLVKEQPGLDYDANFSYKRYNFRANLDINVTKTTQVKVNIGGIMGVTHEPMDNDNGMWTILNWAQPFSSPGIIDGKVIKNDNRYFGNVKLISGLDAFYGSGYSEASKNTMNMNLEFVQDLKALTKGLELRVKGAYNTNYSFTKNRASSTEVWTPFYASSIDGSGLQPGDAGFNYTKEYRVSGKNTGLAYGEKDEKGRDWYLEASLRYARKFAKKHNVTAMLLYNQSKTYYPKQFSAQPSAYVGLVGRLTYDYESKYMAEFNAGYNGSENFAPDKRYGFFPAASVGWILTQEDFMKKQTFVEYLKLRVACGLVGNDNMTNNRYLYLPATYKLKQPGYNFGIDTPQNWQAAIEGRLGNSNVTWEKALKQNYGLEAIFLSNRLKLTLDYFRENRKDILINRKTLPSIYNLTSDILPVVNMGEVSNQGFEVELKWNDKVGSFNYWVQANTSFARNKIVFMDEVIPNEPYMAMTGRPTGLNYGYIAEGMYSESDFEDGKLKPHLPNPGVPVQPGDVKYKDMNNDDLINTDDQTYIGNPKRPEFTFGLNYGINYKGVEVSFNWVGAAGRSIAFKDEFRYPFGQTGNRTLMQFMVDERWTPARAEIATAPRFSQNSREHNYKNSSLWIRDASYLRLKSVKVGYSFQEKPFLKMLGVSALQLFVSGYNLLTFDKIKYMDPEGDPDKENYSYPITQTYNFGVNVTF